MYVSGRKKKKKRKFKKIHSIKSITLKNKEKSIAEVIESSVNIKYRELKYKEQLINQKYLTKPNGRKN